MADSDNDYQGEGQIPRGIEQNYWGIRGLGVGLDEDHPPIPQYYRERYRITSVPSMHRAGHPIDWGLCPLGVIKVNFVYLISAN